MAALNDDEIAYLLLALRNDVPAAAAPAQILDVVPAHGGPVHSEDEDHRRRGLLLSSIGPIVAMMGAALGYITQLFKETDYDVNALFNAPVWGEYLTRLTPEQQQVFCANTAYYIDAMRHNKPLEVITEGGVQKFKPLSSSGSTAVTIVPSSTMRLNGNEVIEKNIAGKLVYKQGLEEIAVPEDPLEMSAFCMAHFFNTENVQILMNWGEDFKLISEEDLLRLLGQMGEGNEWKQRVVGKLLKSAYHVHNQTAAFNLYISRFTPDPAAKLTELWNYIDLEWEMLQVRLPGMTKQMLYQFALDHPNLWAAANNAINYPIPCAFFAFVVLYYLRKPLVALGHITYEAARLPYRILNWLTGRNPDRPGALAIENDGAVRGGGKQQPLSVIVINYPLPSLYLDELAKIFDKDGDIDSFVKHIDMNKVSLPKNQLKKWWRNTKKYLRKVKEEHRMNRDTEKKVKKAQKKLVKYIFPPPSPRSIVNMEYGGRKRSNTNSTKRKHQNKRKTHKR